MSVLLETKRLILRPPKAGDIGQFLPLISDFDVSKNLSRVPHPYTEDDACDFIVRMNAGWASGEDLVFAILRKPDGAYIGTCGLHPARGHEFGYWIGKPYWRSGYATEAATRLIAFAFEEKGVEKLTAKWFHDNPASGRVLEKLRCRPAGEEYSNCLARGYKVAAHVVVLDRTTYMTRKMGA